LEWSVDMLADTAFSRSWWGRNHKNVLGFWYRYFRKPKLASKNFRIL